MMLITKNALVLRDLDLLRELASQRLVSVALSINTLDTELARVMEPRTSSPAARLRAVHELSAAGVPTQVMVAPVIPGLNDCDIPSVLNTAADAGASGAGYNLLRLPLNVKLVFLDWLARTQPTKREKVESHIRLTRDGELTSSQFSQRMRGSGLLAEQIQRTFRVFATKYHLDRRLPTPDTSQFVPPPDQSGQLRLF
jgi:DNA repair photolyase